MYVRNHMTLCPKTVRPATSVREAAELLRVGGFHQLPVVDEAGEVVGIVTDRDVRSGTGHDPDAAAAMRVEMIMTREPVTIDDGASFEDAVQLLARHRFGALPVTRGNKLVGIITKYDLVRALHDILGLDRAGERIEVAIPHGVCDIVRAMQATSVQDRLLSVIASLVRPQPLEPVLFIRTAVNNPFQLERRLRAAGVLVMTSHRQPQFV